MNSLKSEIDPQTVDIGVSTVSNKMVNVLSRRTTETAVIGDNLQTVSQTGIEMDMSRMVSIEDLTQF